MHLFIIAIFAFIFISAIFFRHSKLTNIFYFSICSSLFVLLGLSINTRVSQDLLNYFKIYKNIENDLYNIFDKDFLFYIFIETLPKNMGYELFVLIVSLVSLSLIYFLFKELKNTQERTSLNWDFAPFLMIAIVSDRLIMDLFFNTLRSTWGLLIFMIGLIPLIHNKSFFSNRWFISLFTHMGASLAAILIFNFWKFFKKFRLPALLIFSLIVIFKIYSSIELLSFMKLSYIEVFTKYISFDRAYAHLTNVSLNFLGMIFVSIFLPFLILIYDRGFNFVKQNELVLFTVFFTLIVLIAFIEFSLAKRFFVIPILIFMGFLNLKQMKFIALLKFMLFALYGEGLF